MARIRRIVLFGLLSSAAAVSSVSVCAAPAAAATFTNPAAITINPSTDGGFIAAAPYPSAVNASGLSGTVTDVNVTLNDFTHAFPGYVGAALVAPTGHALLLQFGAGGLSEVTAVDTTFDDSAAGHLPETTAWVSGSYRPTSFGGAGVIPAPGPTDHNVPGPYGTSTIASTFNGLPTNGTWNLFVSNVFNALSGSIAGWSLEILGGGPPLRTLTVTKSGDLTGPIFQVVSLSAGIPVGIDCGSVCATEFRHGESVVLMAAGGGGFSTTWTAGCDSVSGVLCTVNMSSNRTVNVDFSRDATPGGESEPFDHTAAPFDLAAAKRKCKKKFPPGKKRKKCIRRAKERAQRLL